MSQHPEVEAKIAAELDGLGLLATAERSRARPMVYEDLAQLRYLSWVIKVLASFYSDVGFLFSCFTHEHRHHIIIMLNGWRELLMRTIVLWKCKHCVTRHVANAEHLVRSERPCSPHAGLQSRSNFREHNFLADVLMMLSSVSGACAFPPPKNTDLRASDRLSRSIPACLSC